MATWDSADLLARLQDRLRLPRDDNGTMTTTETTTAKLYALLSDAQQIVFNELGQRVPTLFIAAPIRLTSADGGYTYTLKDGAGTTIYGGGHLKVFIRLTDIPDRPLTEGLDYTFEGDLLRVPNNRTWPHGDGPYIQPASEPVDITASQGLTLPTLCGRAIVAQAALLYCKQGGLRDWTPHEGDYLREFGLICTRLRSGVTPRLTWPNGLTFTRGFGAVGR